MKRSKIYKNYFDIVILPPAKIGDYTIKLSKQIHKYGTTWVLGKKNFIPHISLYHIPVKPKDFNSFIADLKTAMKGFRAGKLELKKPILWKNVRTNFIETDKPEWLKKLHMRVVKKTLKYFDWDYGVEKFWHPELPKIMKNNIKKYGTPLIGRYFIPHITLGFFKDDKGMIKAFNELRVRKYNFKVKSIFVCELGENHSCQRIVKRIYF